MYSMLGMHPSAIVRTSRNTLVFKSLPYALFSMVETTDKRSIHISSVFKYYFSRSNRNQLNTSLNHHYNFLFSSCAICDNLNAQIIRHFSKKKKRSGRVIEDEDESDSEDEDYETIEPDEAIDDYNLVTKSVPSMRVDSVLKAGLSITKKKIEKEFYAMKIRKNGEKLLKKAAMVLPGDEIDIINGICPDNSRFLTVDRVIVQSIGKISGNGNYPVKLQVFKSLVIENYSDPWSPSTLE